eukprot:scaffold266382_cov30-Tisochrysis_lutea.AAC.5
MKGDTNSPRGTECAVPRTEMASAFASRARARSATGASTSAERLARRSKSSRQGRTIRPPSTWWSGKRLR